MRVLKTAEIWLFMILAGATWVPVQVWAALTDKPDFSRYQVILNRQPFGKPVQAPPSPPPPNPAGNQPSFISFLRMVAIVEEPDGVRVGFVRIGQPVKPGVPASAAVQEFFYLRVGETSDQGELLVSVDKEQQSAILRKETDQQAISMSSDSGPRGGAVPAGVPGRGGAAFAPSSFPPGSGPRVISVPPTPPVPAEPAPGSYAERLKQRREARDRRNAELMAVATNPARPSAEALEQHLREYNLNLIRQRGAAGPPLPITLTPDEDDQLVKEGVLPPRQ